MKRECPPDEKEEFYLKFLGVVYDVFRVATIDIRELRYAAAYLYPYYLKPIQEVSSFNNNKQPPSPLCADESCFFFLSSIESCYQRTVSKAHQTLRAVH